MRQANIVAVGPVRARPSLEPRPCISPRSCLDLDSISARGRRGGKRGQSGSGAGHRCRRRGWRRGRGAAPPHATLRAARAGSGPRGRPGSRGCTAARAVQGEWVGGGVADSIRVCAAAVAETVHLRLRGPWPHRCEHDAAARRVDDLKRGGVEDDQRRASVGLAALDERHVNTTDAAQAVWVDHIRLREKASQPALPQPPPAAEQPAVAEQERGAGEECG